jgi:hypothetical protein
VKSLSFDTTDRGVRESRARRRSDRGFQFPRVTSRLVSSFRLSTVPQQLVEGRRASWRFQSPRNRDACRPSPYGFVRTRVIPSYAL